MKRIITILLAVCISLNLILPAYAEEVVTEVPATEAAAQPATEAPATEAPATEAAAQPAVTEAPATEAAAQPAATEAQPDRQPSVSEVSENESGPDNPMGDNSAYYNIKKLKSAPEVTAESAILMDANTGAILYRKEARTRRYPASITKVMTALLAIENCSMDDIVTFSEHAVNSIEAGSSSAGINAGTKLTVEETLYALMLVSANEAGAALAEHIAGSNKKFAKMMNERAKELGCTNTNFCNPHGLPNENHYTTAYDMALIVKQAMKYDDFRKFAGEITYTIEENDTMKESIELWNHAKILRDNTEYYYKYAEGAKTGFTQAALNTLISFAKKDDVELICVVLRDYGADRSYKDSTNLYNWGFGKVKGIYPLADFDLRAVLETDETIDKDLQKSIKSLDYSYNKDYYLLAKSNYNENRIRTEFALEEDRNTGLLGYINISTGDKLIGRCPVTYDITSENAVRYLNGQNPKIDNKELVSNAEQKARGVFNKTYDKVLDMTNLNLTKKEFLVCLGAVFIIILVIILIIISLINKARRKKIRKNISKKLREELEMNPPTKRRRRK